MKEEKEKISKKVPKVVELDTVLTSYLDSTMDFGTKISMSGLANELQISRNKDGHPHPYTVRNKLDEAFKYVDVLKNFKQHRTKKGILSEIEKIEPKEVNMERVLDALLKIKEEISNLRKEIETLKHEKSNTTI